MFRPHNFLGRRLRLFLHLSEDDEWTPGRDSPWQRSHQSQPVARFFTDLAHAPPGDSLGYSGDGPPCLSGAMLFHTRVLCTSFRRARESCLARFLLWPTIKAAMFSTLSLSKSNRGPSPTWSSRRLRSAFSALSCSSCEIFFSVLRGSIGR